MEIAANVECSVGPSYTTNYNVSRYVADIPRFDSSDSHHQTVKFVLVREGEAPAEPRSTGT
ncbi:MAG: hypothetical protein HY304_00785 [candidate division Zixibacteria bacterium]|nr:hypothetical protein [candidate division Zixibacteria bacterium]